MAILEEFGKSIRTIQNLGDVVDSGLIDEESIKKVIKKFPMQISEYYLSLINWDDENDPIKKMVIPSDEELTYKDVGIITHEQDNTKILGLQHKYEQTALILVSNQCATICRYCFRKRFVGIHYKEVIDKFDNAIVYLKEHPEINNVLLSGGDPLMLPNDIIQYLFDELDKIPNLKFIRIGSKVPVTYPMRISKDPELLEILARASRPDRRLHIQTHFNHPTEITDEAKDAINCLFEAKVFVHNQTVLLRGVNDNSEVLANLLNSLVGIGVNPYYIFQCRPFKSTASAFQVPFNEGIEIVENAKKLCNGQSKRFKYVLSHISGKIEIVGKLKNKIIFKYHQAKNPADLGTIFLKRLHSNEVWLWEGYD